uniref:NADH-ubiquinone oxidoreductase chain 4 n=3 Tax=Tettigarcta crinita TaxID=295286 RepID=A0A3Q8G778_9HEMI|nr:NADH dehydrogenase subunit 4 [Tettigarcta crinita]
MLKLILFMIMLIPLSLMNWWLVTCSLLIMIMFFISISFSMNFYMTGYFMGIDKISYGLIVLSIWICLLMIMSSPSYKYDMYYFISMILILLFFLVLSFCTLNLFLFYIFFESSLIPTIIIILGWGYQPERILSSYYLLFYTLIASMPLLVSIFYLNMCYYTSMMSLIVIIDNNMLLYFSLLMAFLIKMPIFMFHFWLPKAHVEAPVSGSMILAGVLLKLGGYGLMRLLYIMPNMIYMFSYMWIALSMLGGFLVSLLCLIQVDLKSLIAYSSVVHMGLVISGMMTLNIWGYYGSYYLMIGHGLCSSALFCLVNILYERTGSRSMLINKGMINFMPSMSLMWFLLCSSNMACPPTINLGGEILIINGLMSWCLITAMFIGLISFMSACYSLYMYSYTQHGNYYSGMNSFMSGFSREYLMLFLHWLPLNLLILKINVLF